MAKAVRIMTSTMLRRSFITIHAGHLGPRWDQMKVDSDLRDDNHLELMQAYFEFLKFQDWKELGFLGVALALERCDSTDRTHVQGYLEHKQKRFTTLGKNFEALSTCFDKVRNAPGSYDYCTGSGEHEGKFAFARFLWGDFKLSGGGPREDLRQIVTRIVDGSHPSEILKSHPYEYTVHRNRIWNLYFDLKAQDNLESNVADAQRWSR